MTTPSFPPPDPTGGTPPEGQPGYGPPPGSPYAPPGESGPPPGYGPPPAYGTPPGYGPPLGYGPPPGYGAPAGYGAPGDPGLAGGHLAGPGQPGGPELATWGVRAVGYLIDFVIAFVVQVVLGTVSDTLGSLAGIGMLVVFAYLESQDGRTPGRRVMGTRLLREVDGTPPGLGTAVGRRLLHILDALPLLLGFLWPLWDEKRQTFADKIVKTVVIRG